MTCYASMSSCMMSSCLLCFIWVVDVLATFPVNLSPNVLAMPKFKLSRDFRVPVHFISCYLSVDYFALIFMVRRDVILPRVLCS